MEGKREGKGKGQYRTGTEGQGRDGKGREGCMNDVPLDVRVIGDYTIYIIMWCVFYQMDGQAER